MKYPDNPLNLYYDLSLNIHEFCVFYRHRDSEDIIPRYLNKG